MPTQGALIAVLKEHNKEDNEKIHIIYAILTNSGL